MSHQDIEWRCRYRYSVLPLGVDTSSTAYHVGQVAGLVIAVVVAVVVVRSYRGPVLSAGVVLVAAALVIFGVKDLRRGGSNEAWATSQGINVRAGFMAGCDNGVSARLSTCECMFQHVSSVPPYNTPSGFMGLAVSVQRYEQTGDPSALPSALIEAGRNCAR